MASPPRKKDPAKPAPAKAKIKKSAGAKAAAQPAPDSAYGIRMRHYCQGIGDCHLLSFPRPGQADFKILIDCGVHGAVPGGRKTIDAVVADLAHETGGYIDVVVVTHEHIDHTSGFLSARQAFAGIKVGQVWMAWTENGNDPQGRQIDKYKGAAVSALTMVSRHLKGAAAADSYAGRLRTGIDALLGFQFNAAGDTSRAARDAAAALGPVRYLEPADDPIELAGTGVRAFVLGPSRNQDYLKITDRASEMYGLSGMSSPLWSVASVFGAGALYEDDPEFDTTTPFDPSVGDSLSALRARAAAPAADDALGRLLAATYYAGEAQDFRRIDYDWAASGADLAMQLDAKTNNTSLVLAFEFADTGRVFLFTADAQIGSWLSWQDAKWPGKGRDGRADVTGPDLLSRTVFLKVGHHGSQNATAMGKGLELMTSPDLTAFVPTNKDDAKNVKWGAMPFDAIMNRLQVKTQGRVVRADDPWPLLPEEQWPAAVRTPSGSLVATRTAAFTHPDTQARRCLYVEFDVK